MYYKHNSPDHSTIMDRQLDISMTIIPLFASFIIFIVFIILFMYFISYLISFTLLNSLKN